MRDLLLTLHLAAYYNLVLVGTIAVVWGIVLLARHDGYTPGFRSILWVVAGVGVMQGLLGGILYLTGCRPADILHLVYGLIVVAAIPVAYTYASESITRRDMAVLAFAAFAIVAAALRAYATGLGGSCPP